MCQCQQYTKAEDRAAEFHLQWSSEASSLSSRRDLLFEQLYSRLVENTVAKGVFLESLESYIVADRLGHLTTPIMRDLLAHYHSSGLMDSLERCIVHLDITSLDIQQVCLPELPACMCELDEFGSNLTTCECVNQEQTLCKKCAVFWCQVVQVCWENKLHDALVYVFNRGMNDYVTPMEVSCRSKWYSYPEFKKKNVFTVFFLLINDHFGIHFHIIVIIKVINKSREATHCSYL